LFFRKKSLRVAEIIAEDFMKDRPKKPPAPERLPVLVDDCPCTQIRCHRHGNCVECIRVHRTRQEHIPECLQDMFRSRVKELAVLVEYDIRDLRRTPAYWDERLGKEPPSPPRGAGGFPAKKPSGKRSAAKRK
jgi:hypothetical protein